MEPQQTLEGVVGGQRPGDSHQVRRDQVVHSWGSAWRTPHSGGGGRRLEKKRFVRKEAGPKHLVQTASGKTFGPAWAGWLITALAPQLVCLGQLHNTCCVMGWGGGVAQPPKVGWVVIYIGTSTGAHLSRPLRLSTAWAVQPCAVASASVRPAIAE